MAHVNLPKTSQSGSNEWADVEDNDQAIVDEINGNLDADNLAANAVGSSELAASAVTTVKIADSNVTAAKIQDLAVGTAEIADLAVTTGKLADGAATSAKVSLTSSEDTQSADISATGVLTGISITPGAGTYLAIASARFLGGAAADSATLSLRVNGVNVVNGPEVKVSATSDAPAMVVHGIITPTAGQAVQTHATITSGGGTPNVSTGRLTLLRVA
jgi:hypothetical protein